MPKQDAGYKLLFSHAILVRDFVHAFFPYTNDPSKEPPPDATQKISGSWIDESKILRRDNDIAWLCKTQDEDKQRQFILLIEFQTHPDPIMPVRLNSYASLLSEEIHRSGRMTTPDLPRIFPIVLYNGLRPWNAPLSFHQTQQNEPLELSPWQPQSQYFLIDQLHLPNYQLPSPDNLAGLLIRIERSVNPQEATQWLGRLAQRLKELGEENFQKSVVAWLTHSFLPTRMPNIELQELHTIEQIIMSIDNNTMDWSVQYIEQGREEGRTAGLEEGRVVGREEGREEGQLTLILRLLIRKFGPLPTGLKTRLEASDRSTLNKIADALLELNSIEELKSILD